jgi:hypothetical protein
MTSIHGLFQVREFLALELCLAQKGLNFIYYSLLLILVINLINYTLRSTNHFLPIVTNFSFLEIGSCYVGQLALNSQSSCLSLLNAEITEVCYTQLFVPSLCII